MIKLTRGQLPTLQFFKLRWEGTVFERFPTLTAGQARRAVLHDRTLEQTWEELKRQQKIMEGAPGHLPNERHAAEWWLRETLATFRMEWI